ncbi:MAG: hypothetical protein ABFD81_19085 [Syntrophaceae bacterium]
MQYEFGSGVLWGIPKQSLTGSTITVPTPVLFGAIQDVTIDIAWTKKELFGMYQFPLAVARGTAKIDCKAKSAALSAGLFNLIFGETLSTGEIKGAFQEAGTIPGSSSYVVTVTNSANFVTDLGVTYALTGLPMTRVSGSPAAAGEYSVTSGVYTFHADDKSLGVLISYTYTSSAAPGKNFTINNQLLGQAPIFQVVLNQSYQGNIQNIQLFSCMSTKLTLATKLEDFMIPEFDFSAFANSAQQVGSISLAMP